MQTPEETLATASGSCRDSAWLLVQILRHLGLAARFVSGYLIQFKPDVRRSTGRVGTDARLHRPACLGRSLPSGRRLDRPRPDVGPALPARAICRSPRRRITARRRRSPAPSSRPRSTFSFEMKVDAHRRERRASRCRSPTKPGRRSTRSATRSTRDLQRRTCGSPWAASRPSCRSTTISAAEWNTAALGPTKRERADELIRRLRERFAPGGLLHYGQGKWYPGEPLPRWAFALYWRRDGKPIWRDPTLIARESGRRRRPRDADDAATLREAIAARLGIAAEMRAAGLRGPGRTACSRKASCRTTSIQRSQARRSGGARAHRARVFERGLARRRATCCRCSAGTRRRTPAGSARTGDAARPAVPDAGRFADRLPPAARLAAATCRRPTIRYLVPADPIGAARPLPDRATIAAGIAAAAEAACSAPQRRQLVHGRQPRSRPRRAGAAARRSGAHRARGRAARRPALRVHAAGRAARGLSRAARRRRGDRRATRAAGACRRLPAARRSAPQRHQGDARSRRDRGQRPSGRELARGGRHHARRSTRTRGVAGSAPTSSCSTAATPAPAAATTSCSAARRRPTARSCAGPTCSRASCSTGSAIPRSPTCSPACSSARPARRRASTRRATTCSTSWRSRSRRCRRRARARRRAVAGRSPVPQSPGRRHRQHPSRRDLHRQAVLARGADRPARPGRVPRRSRCRRDARMSLAQQLLLRALVAWFWREPQRRRAGALGHGAARPLHAGAFRLGGFSRRARRSARAPATASIPSGSTRSASSAFRSTARSSTAASSSSCARRSSPGTCWARKATAGGTARFVDSSVERLQVKVEGFNAGAPRRHLQRPARAARRDRPVAANTSPASASRPGSCRRRCIRPSPCTRRSPSTSIDRWSRPLARRLRLPRRPSRRPQLRDLPGQLLRGGGAAAGALPGSWPHAGIFRYSRGRTLARVSR